MPGQDEVLRANSEGIVICSRKHSEEYLHEHRVRRGLREERNAAK